MAAYLIVLAVPIALALAVIGSRPSLLARVPEEYRGVVAAFGEGVTRLSGQGGRGAGRNDDVVVLPDALRTIDGTLPLPAHGEWTPRRPEDFPPPAGLTPGLDYSVEVTDSGFIAHWPCRHEIPVRTYGAPPGSEGDLIWAVETLAAASGLSLVYAGPGEDHQRDAEGEISVYYGDHPMFVEPGVSGVGGAEVYPHGLALRGSVTIKPDQVTPFPGDPWSRSLSLHELMHAVGLDHAPAFAPEVMAERTEFPARTEFGRGDLFGLYLVGCH